MHETKSRTIPRADDYHSLSAMIQRAIHMLPTSAATIHVIILLAKWNSRIRRNLRNNSHILDLRTHVKPVHMSTRLRYKSSQHPPWTNSTTTIVGTSHIVAEIHLHINNASAQLRRRAQAQEACSHAQGLRRRRQDDRHCSWQTLRAGRSRSCKCSQAQG